MLGLGALLLAATAVVGLIFGTLRWVRQRGLPAAGGAAAGVQGARHVSLLTEAVAYVGGILLLAGGAAAIGSQWNHIAAWGQVSIFAGAAAFFLLVGITVYRVREPAIQRLVDVAWFVSAAAVAWAAGLAAHEVYHRSGTVTVFAVGVAVTVYAAALWLIRRHALQNLALFAGLVTTVCGTIIVIAATGLARSLAISLALWALGLAWAALGWRRYVEPVWVTIGCGVLLALAAPTLAVTDYGWMYAIALATAAAAMAGSVPLRNTPLLGAGTLAMFGYVTAAVVRYFSESLGTPAALAITGVLIIGLAVLSARLMRATRPAKPTQPAAEKPAHAIRPPKPREPSADESHRDLSKAS